MTDAGVDTEAVVRTGMVGFMEGAMLHGIFHGDLHGGNLMVLPDGRTALLDFGITGRLSEQRRLAFLRLLMSATANDLTGQLESLRDLGALPPDTDIQAVIRDLGLDGPVLDPAAQVLRIFDTDAQLEQWAIERGIAIAHAVQQAQAQFDLGAFAEKVAKHPGAPVARTGGGIEMWVEIRLARPLQGSAASGKALRHRAPTGKRRRFEPANVVDRQ